MIKSKNMKLWEIEHQDIFGSAWRIFQTIAEDEDEASDIWNIQYENMFLILAGTLCKMDRRNFELILDLFEKAWIPGEKIKKRLDLPEDKEFILYDISLGTLTVPFYSSETDFSKAIADFREFIYQFWLQNYNLLSPLDTRNWSEIEIKEKGKFLLDSEIFPFEIKYSKGY